MQAILARLQAGLLPALKGGEQGGTLHARRLTTALQACPASKLTALLALGPSSAACWTATLCRCFAFERSAAALLMHNTSRAGPHALLAPPPVHDSSASKLVTQGLTGLQGLQAQAEDSGHLPQQSATPQTQLGSSDQREPATATGTGIETKIRETGTGRGTEATGNTPDLRPEESATGRVTYHSQQAEQISAAAFPSATQSDAVMLPRMALGLTHITSQATYNAVAGVARTLGHATAVADLSADLAGMLSTASCQVMCTDRRSVHAVPCHVKHWVCYMRLASVWL